MNFKITPARPKIELDVSLDELRTLTRAVGVSSQGQISNEKYSGGIEQYGETVDLYDLYKALQNAMQEAKK